MKSWKSREVKQPRQVQRITTGRAKTKLQPSRFPVHCSFDSISRYVIHTSAIFGKTISATGSNELLLTVHLHRGCWPFRLQSQQESLKLGCWGGKCNRGCEETPAMVPTPDVSEVWGMARGPGEGAKEQYEVWRDVVWWVDLSFSHYRNTASSKKQVRSLEWLIVRSTTRPGVFAYEPLCPADQARQGQRNTRLWKAFRISCWPSPEKVKKGFPYRGTVKGIKAGEQNDTVG